MTRAKRFLDPRDPRMSDLYRIDIEDGLYVLKTSGGYSCLGFLVADQRMRDVAKWLNRSPSNAKPGTEEHYAQYEATMAAGAEHNAHTGGRCDAGLIPELIGREGRRVEVTFPDGTKTRFIVGKSTGWMPIHLEIKTRWSSGGGSVYFPEGATVRNI